MSGFVGNCSDMYINGLLPLSDGVSGFRGHSDQTGCKLLTSSSHIERALAFNRFLWAEHRHGHTATSHAKPSYSCWLFTGPSDRISDQLPF